MADDIARAEVAEVPATRPIEKLPVPRQELHGRLERLADKHPASPRYGPPDWGQPPGVDRLISEGPARSHFDRVGAGGADGGGADGGSADGGGADGGAGAADESRESGWQAPGVRDHPDRPDPAEVRLLPDRSQHILAGDGPNAVSGGHRPGTGIPRKTEFPERWSDDMIIATVQDVARKPDVAHWQEYNSRWNVSGERDGVTVTAIVQRDGSIWAASPEPGGYGVTKNPEV